MVFLSSFELIIQIRKVKEILKNNLLQVKEEDESE
jgi:hypothetical protein